MKTKFLALMSSLPSKNTNNELDDDEVYSYNINDYKQDLDELMVEFSKIKIKVLPCLKLDMKMFYMI